MDTSRKRYYKGIKRHKNSNNYVIEKFSFPRRSELPIDLFSQLPEDILKLILMSSRLSFADRILASAVCKDWLRILHLHEVPISPLPWIMTYQCITRKKKKNNNNNNNHVPYDDERGQRYHQDQDGETRGFSVFLKYELFDPCNIDQKPYIVEHEITTSFSGGIGSDKYNFVRARACAAKDGWVMLYSPNKVYEWDKSFRVYFFFLYSPFTKEVIKLPDLVSEGFDLATFSASPSSGGCVFFILGHNYNYDGLIIRTCSLGDETWKRHIIHGHHPEIQDVVYVNESFYCVSGTGRLTAFNVARQVWTTLSHFVPFRTSDCRKPHLVESNGELLMVNLSNYEPTSYCSIFKFDKTRKAWVHKQGLEERALFIGQCSSYLISTAGEAALKNIANKVYYNPSFPYSTKLCYLKDDNTICQNCKGSEIFSWAYREHGRDGIWIQPPIKCKVRVKFESS